MTNICLSGVVAECQQERSQLKNKEKAMKALRAKLYSMKLEEETSKRYNQRKIQVFFKYYFIVIGKHLIYEQAPGSSLHPIPLISHFRLVPKAGQRKFEPTTFRKIV